MKYAEKYRGLFITAATARGRVVLVVTRPDGTPLYLTQVDEPGSAADEGEVAPELAVALSEIRRRIDDGDYEE